MNNKLNVPKWPYAEEKDKEEVIKVLNSGIWWRNAGKEVKLFEKEFAHFQGCVDGISVANGTVAIEIALKALNIGLGDEVIVPDFTFYSTVSAVLAVGAIPCMVDVSSDDFCINVNEIKKSLTEKTKAIIVVHMAGNMCDMDAINELARKKGLYVIEDSSHAHGAEYKNRKAGSLSDCGTFSFQNAKLLTAGEGGIITSNNKEFLHRAFLESNCGREENDTTYQHVIAGTNARLSEIQGALLRMQLTRLEDQAELRIKNYKYLEKLLDDIKGIKLQKNSVGVTKNSHYMIMFYYNEECFNGKSRSEFVEYLRENGIPSNRAFEALHKLPVFKTIEKDLWRVAGNGCPNSEYIASNVVNISHNVLLGDFDLMDSIADKIRGFGRL